MGILLETDLLTHGGDKNNIAIPGMRREE